MDCSANARVLPMTTTAQVSAGPSTDVRPKRPFRRFFSGMALFALAVLIFAFVPEYVQYSRGSFPIAWVLHIHGAIMAAWIGVFSLQAYLGATGRIAQHRKTGNFAFAIGWLAWASMIFVEWRHLLVNAPPDDIRVYDWLLPGPYVYFTFPLFLAWAYRTRQRPEWHKRLITFAVFLSLQAAIQRFLWIPVSFGYWPFAGVLDVCLLIPLVVYDLRPPKRSLHPATVQGALALFAAQAILFSLWGTAAWRHFASAVAHAVRR
jgi:hypothetical protein